MNQYYAYMKAVRKALRENVTYRYGQALYNVLKDFDPEFVEEITGTDLDPFYREKNDITVMRFCEAVRDRLESKNS